MSPVTSETARVSGSSDTAAPSGRIPARRRSVSGTPHRIVAPDTTDAMAVANASINRYRGVNAMPAHLVTFVRDAVRDALPNAPQPVTKAWVRYSLTVVSRLVMSGHVAGVPLERDHVFARSRLTRFIHHDCANMATQAQAGYRSRLDVIAEALLTSRTGSSWPRAALSAVDVVTPYTAKEMQRLHGWSFTAHPAPRRARVQTLIALGAGAGLRRRDAILVRGTDVRRDEHGVHVTVPDGPTAGSSRTITVLATWENEVWAAAQIAGSDLLLASTQTTLAPEALDRTVGYVNDKSPVLFNIRRLRNTWLATHLMAGTPLPVLMPAAGLETTAHLADLLPLLSAPAPALSAAFMRGTRP